MMIKKVVLCLFLVGISVSAENIETKVQDVSPQQLQKQNKEIVKLAAAELSKNLPQKIDKYTTVTNIKAKNTSLIYTFELNVPDKSDEEIRSNDKARMQRAVRRGVCLSSKRFMEAKITIVYRYVSHKTKKTLFEFSISKKDCQKIYREIR